MRPAAADIKESVDHNSTTTISSSKKVHSLYLNHHGAVSFVRCPVSNVVRVLLLVLSTTYVKSNAFSPFKIKDFHL